jgi:hypothetical protein
MVEVTVLLVFFRYNRSKERTMFVCKPLVKHSSVKRIQKKQASRKAQTMIVFIIFVLLLIALGLTAVRWGSASRNGIASPEWQRRALLDFQSHRA